MKKPEEQTLSILQFDTHPNAQYGYEEILKAENILQKMNGLMLLIKVYWNGTYTDSKISEMASCWQGLIPLVENNYNVCELGSKRYW